MQWKYTPEMTDWIRQNCPNVEWDDVATAFNAQFGTDKTARQLRTHAHDNGIHNGIYHGRCTTGNRNRPVGSTRLDKDGYVVIKIAEPCHWRRAQLVEWEKHYEPIDIRKEMLLFLDGNRQNYNIDNLFLLPRKYIAIFNRNDLWKLVSKETIDSVMLIADTMAERWNKEIELHGGYRQACIAKARRHWEKVRNDPELYEKSKQQKREYYRNHKEQCNAKSREWANNNPEKRREIARKYARNKKCQNTSRIKTKTA